MPIERSGFSEFLHRRRLTLRQSWKEVISNAYMSRATLHRIRHGDPHHPIAEVDSLRALAHALKFRDWAELVAAYDANDLKKNLAEPAPAPIPTPGGPSGGEPRPNQDAILSLSQALNVSPTELVRRLAIGGAPQEPDELPASLRTHEMRPARFIPHFTSGVAASRRVEKLEDEDFESRQPAGTEDLRVFTIPVDGDCQEPAWKDGEIVLFSFDAYEREGILPGKSYYLAFTDGSTTFKRVFTDDNDPDVYILRCWNTKKYPRERRVHFNEVVRIARAISKQVVPVEEEL
jgi:hypothetical protein